jgi:protease IV
VAALSGGDITAGGGAGRVAEDVIKQGGRDKVAILPASGTVDEQMVERVRKYVRAIEEDSSIKAVVVEVDSPGGGITASDEIHHLLTQLRGSGKRVVVSMGGLAASGGYYVSMPGEKIYAEPTTLTGSIGVIMATFDATELMTKIGVAPETVKSDMAEKYKDMGSPFRKWTAEDEKYFKGILNNAHEKFQKVVVEGRKGKLTQPIGEIAIGKVWPAEKAKELGLIDEIAYLDEVCVKTASEAGISNPTVVRLKPKVGFLDVFGASAPGTKVELRVDTEALRMLKGGGMEYRYEGIH